MHVTTMRRVGGSRKLCLRCKKPQKRFWWTSSTTRTYARSMPSASLSSRKTSNSQDDCEQRGVRQSEVF